MLFSIDSTYKEVRPDEILSQDDTRSSYKAHNWASSGYLVRVYKDGKLFGTMSRKNKMLDSESDYIIMPVTA